MTNETTIQHTDGRLYLIEWIPARQSNALLTAVLASLMDLTEQHISIAKDAAENACSNQPTITKIEKKYYVQTSR